MAGHSAQHGPWRSAEGPATIPVGVSATVRERRRPSLSGLAWPLINAFQAVLTALWCIGGISCGLMLRWLTGGPEATQTVARHYWAPFLIKAAGAKVEVVGLDRLPFDRPYVFVLNHRSILDIPLAIAALPSDLYFVAKEELRRVPLLGRYLEAMGMVFVERGRRISAVRSLDRACDLLRAGKSLASFPEGTRSPFPRVRPFKTGVFMAAIETGTPVVPVAIEGAERLLPPGSFRVRPGPVRIELGKPISVEGLDRGDRRRLAARARCGIVALLGGASAPD